jgi:hypothetical protein
MRTLYKTLWSPYPLLNLCYIRNGLLFVNSQVLNRHQVCMWFWSFQMIKIMQMEMLNVAALLQPGRPLVMAAM